MQLLFVVYMIIVAILLVNMLIAMMGNTYQKIAETRNEWQRQWARIVLVVERGVPPAQRLKQLMTYSQPMANGKRALVLRINQKVCMRIGNKILTVYVIIKYRSFSNTYFKGIFK